MVLLTVKQQQIDFAIFPSWTISLSQSCAIFRNCDGHAIEKLFSRVSRMFITIQIRLPRSFLFNFSGVGNDGRGGCGQFRIEIAAHQIQIALQLLPQTLILRVGNFSNPSILQEGKKPANRSEQKKSCAVNPCMLRWQREFHAVFKRILRGSAA